jgi:hypothetical protein
VAGNDSLREASLRAVGPGDVVLVLLLGAARKADEKSGPVGLYEVLSANFMTLARGPLKEPFHKLFLTWLDCQTEPSALENGLEAGMWAPVPGVAPVARRVVKDPKAVETRLAAHALLALGHYGTRDDLARLGAFRADARVYHVYRRVRGDPLEVQVRDVAAAMSLKLRGEDAAKHGFREAPFKSWWSEPRSYAAPLPFESAEARTEAHKNVWEWLDKQPDAPPKPSK